MVFTTIIVKSKPHVYLPTWIMADIVLKTDLETGGVIMSVTFLLASAT